MGQLCKSCFISACESRGLYTCDSKCVGKCDGVVQCADLSDEMSCSKSQQEVYMQLQSMRITYKKNTNNNKIINALRINY